MKQARMLIKRDVDVLRQIIQWPRSYSIVLLTLLCMTTLFSPTTSFASPFASPKGYILDFPAGWAVNMGENGSDVLFLGPLSKPIPQIASTVFAPTMSVTVSWVDASVAPSTLLAAWHTQTVAAMKAALAGSKVVAEGPCFVGGYSGYSFTGLFTPAGTPAPLRFREAYAIHGNTAYLFLDSALDKDFDALLPSYLATEKSFALEPFNTTAYTSHVGIQFVMPAGWTAQPMTAPNLVTFVETVPDGQFPANILVRARVGLGLDVDTDRVYSLRDNWNNMYRALPGYAAVDQGIMMIAGERAFYTIWSQDGTNPPKRMRILHIMYPRNGVLIEIVATCLESDYVHYSRLIMNCIKSLVWCPPTPAPAPTIAPANATSVPSTTPPIAPSTDKLPDIIQ